MTRFRPPSWLLFVGVGLVGFAVFLPSLSCGFVNWDDDRNFLNNPDFRGLAWTNIRWMFSAFLMGHYQPLSWLTLGLDYTVWGMNPQGYHLTNIVLHAVNTALLGAVVARLGAIGGVKRAGWLGAGVALAWAIHPLRVEAVTWITQRREVLCAAFTLLTLLMHLRGARWWSIALLSGVAMLCKATAVVLPVMLVLIDVWREGVVARLGTGHEGRRAWRLLGRIVVRHGVVVAMAGVCSVVAVIAQRSSGALAPVESLGIVPRLMSYFYSVGFYTLKSVWPSNLCALYEIKLETVEGQLRPVRGVVLLDAGLVAAAVVSLLSGGWLLRRREPRLLLFTVALLAMIAPVGGLGQAGPQLVADRYAYQPGWVLTLGAALLLAGLARRAAPGRSTALAASLSVAIAAALGVFCVRQQGFWRNTSALWDRVLAIDPECGYGHFNLAMQAISQSPPNDLVAEPHLREAIRVQPWNPEPRAALGALHERAGKIAEAEEDYRGALKVAASHKPSLFPLAVIVFNKGKHEEALGLLSRLANTDPENPESYRALGRALAADNKGYSASGVFRDGVKKSPGSMVLWRELAWLLATNPDNAVRNGVSAVEAADKAMALVPTGTVDPTVIVAAGAAYAEAERFEDGVRIIRGAQAKCDEGTRATLGKLIELLEKREKVRAAAVFP